MGHTIFCLLPGSSSPFQVDIPETQTVGHLKDAIKLQMSQTLSTTGAHTLLLHLVEIDASDNEKAINEAETIFQTLRTLSPWSAKFLNATSSLKTVFKSRAPTPGSIHILVLPPRGELLGPRM